MCVCVCGGCSGGVLCVCVCVGGGGGGGYRQYQFYRHHQLLFSLKICRVYPGVLLRHFKEYAVLRDLVVIHLYGLGEKPCGRKRF